MASANNVRSILDLPDRFSAQKHPSIEEFTLTLRIPPNFCVIETWKSPGKLAASTDPRPWSACLRQHGDSCQPDARCPLFHFLRTASMRGDDCQPRPQSAPMSTHSAPHWPCTQTTMVLLLNHDILSEVLVHFRIWECIEILTVRLNLTIHVTAEPDHTLIDISRMVFPAYSLALHPLRTPQNRSNRLPQRLSTPRH